MKKLLLSCIALTLIASSSAETPSLNLGFGFGIQANPPPLSLPLVQQNSGTFTFLGSFKIPQGNAANCGPISDQPCFNFPWGAMSVNQAPVTLHGNTYPAGTILWASNQYYDPAAPNAGNIGSMNGGGIAAIQIPTLSGAPVYTGLNGTAQIPSGTTRGTGSGLIYTAPASFTASPTPSAGNTSAILNALPGAIAANAGWYAHICTNGGCTLGPFVLVTSVNTGTNTIGWVGGLAAGAYTGAVSIHQWQPLYPWGNASGDHIVGTLYYNGNLYVAGSANYDTTGSATIAWSLQSTPDGTSWGGAYSTPGPSNCTGATTLDYSRRFAGSLNITPSLWQSIVGSPAYSTSGFGLSGVSANTTIGFGMHGFDPANITNSGGTIAPVQLQDYCYEPAGSSAYGVNGRSLRMLNSRLFVGPSGDTQTTAAPVPFQTGYTGPYYPATLASTPTAGNTTLTIAVPTTTATVTANYATSAPGVTCNGGLACVLQVTSINTGTVSNSAIHYTVTGPSLGAGNFVNPGWDLGPGVAVSCSVPTPCNFILHTAVAAASGQAVTMTPIGYLDGYWQICITSDGECRIGHLKLATGSVTFPLPMTLPNSCNTTHPNCDPSSFTALTCSPSCGTAVTVAPMGDGLVAQIYDGPVGTGFIAPGSRSWLVVTMHQHGPLTVRNDPCKPGSSGSNEIPLKPDTQLYVSQTLVAYDMQDIINSKNGVASDTHCPGGGTGTIGFYAACPYSTWNFPGESVLHQANGCLFANTLGWAAYDPTNQILYTMYAESNFTTGQTGIVYEWHVNTL